MEGYCEKGFGILCKRFELYDWYRENDFNLFLFLEDMLVILYKINWRYLIRKVKLGNRINVVGVRGWWSLE